MSKLDELAKKYKADPSEKNFNNLFKECQPTIITFARRLYKRNSWWTKQDYEDCYSFLTIKISDLIQKDYPKMPIPANPNFIGLLGKRLSWGIKDFLKNLIPDAKKHPKMPLHLQEGISPTNTFKMIEDKDFVQQIRNKCKSSKLPLIAILDLLSEGFNPHQIRGQLEIGNGLMSYYLKVIRNIAEDLLKISDPANINKVQCNTCKEWKEVKEYWKCPSNKNGLLAKCIMCGSAANKKNWAIRKARRN